MALQHPPEASGSHESARLNAPDIGAAAQSSPYREADGTRRSEILQTAASLFASSGLRTSLQEIADAAGILPGSLYHHFESKEAILVELLQRYHADLDRIGEAAQQRLDDADSRPVSEKIVQLGSAIAKCAVRHSAALAMSFHEAPSANPELMQLVQRPRPPSTRRCYKHCGPAAGVATSDPTSTFRRWPTGSVSPCCTSVLMSSGKTPPPTRWPR